MTGWTDSDQVIDLVPVAAGTVVDFDRTNFAARVPELADATITGENSRTTLTPVGGQTSAPVAARPWLALMVRAGREVRAASRGADC